MERFFCTAVSKPTLAGIKYSLAVKVIIRQQFTLLLVAKMALTNYNIIKILKNPNKNDSSMPAKIHLVTIL